MQIPGLQVKLDESALAWRATRHRGIEWIPLHPDAGTESTPESHDSTVLIRMAPGCGYPPHRHLGVEEVFVLRAGDRRARGRDRLHVGRERSEQPGSPVQPGELVCAA